MSEFVAQIEAEFDLSKVQEQLEKIKKQKVELEVELKNKDAAKALKNSIEKGLKTTKLDTSTLSKQLADSFNIKDKSVVNQIKSQLNSMFSDLSKSWNGKEFVDPKNFFNGLDSLGDYVIKNANIIQSKLGIYDQFYDYFKDKRIYISDALKNAMGEDNYKELLNNNIGKITKDATKGIAIDSLWPEMTQLFPEHFADNITNQVDQIVRAFDVLRAARADIDNIFPASNLSPQDFSQFSDSVWDQLGDMANRMPEMLQKNIQTVAESSATTFDLNIDINTDKIISDIRAALQEATTSMDDAIQINAKLNDEEIVSQLRAAIGQLSSGDEPVQVDIQINKQNLQADLEAALQNLDLPIHFNVDAEELETNIRNAVNAITDIEIDLHVNTDGLRHEVDNAVTGRDIQIPDVDVTGMRDMERILGNINGAGVRGQSVFQALGGSFREAFSTFTLANMLQDAIYKVGDAGRKAIETVKELNDAAVNLQMATGQSYDSVSKMLQDYNTLGKELGSITTDVASGADSWLRQGKSISETNTLIKDTMVLAKVSNLETADSTEYLTSAMNGYKVAVDDVMGIVDKVSAIDLASATDAGGLMEAMSKVATTANMAGISMDKLLAILATTGEVTQASMSSIGNAYKTVISRMSDIKTGKFKLIDEDGTEEILSDVEQTLANVGIDLRKTVTEYNSYSDVLDALARKWNSLSQLQQNAISKAFAGTRQAENFRVLMENYDRVYKYTEIAQNSSGTAEEKFGYYLESLEAKTNSLKASLEALASSTIPVDLYSGFLDGAKAIVDFTEQTDLLKASLAGLGAAGAGFAVQQLTGWIRGAVQEFSNLSEAMSVLRTGNLSTQGFQNLLQLTQGLSRSQTELVLSSTALSNAQRVAILMNQGLSQAEAQASVATMGLAGTQGAATGATVTLSGALHGLWATLLANPLVMVAAGVTASVMAFSAYQRSVEEAVDVAKKAGDEFVESGNTLDECMEHVAELRTQLDSGTLSEEQAYTVKSELLSIQQALTESYGDAAKGLDLMNGSLQTQLDLMRMLSVEDANKFLNQQGTEGKKGIKTVKAKIEDDNDYILGMNIPDYGSEFSEKIKSIAKSMADAGVSLTQNMDGTFNIRFVGDATEAENVIGEFQNQIRGLGDMAAESGLTAVFEDISGYSSDAYKSASDILDEYLETYNQIKQAEMTLDTSILKTSYDENDVTKSYAEMYVDYAKAINNYNDALMSGDLSKIQEAKTVYDAIRSDVDKFAMGSSYRGLFEGLGETLNEASIKYQDFTALLSDTEASESAQKLSDDYTKTFEDLPKKYAEALKEMEMTDVDFKDALFTDGIQKGETAVNALVKAAQDMGIITGSSASEVQPLIDILGNLGYISVGTAGDLNTLADSAENVETSFSDLAKDNSAKLLDELDTVKSALTSQSTGVSLNYGDFTSDELQSYRSALEYVNGTMQLNTEKVRELTEVKVKEQVATNETAKAQRQQEYLQNAKQIETLRQKILDNNFATGESAEAIQMQIAGLIASNDAIDIQCGQLDLLNSSLMESIGVYEQWKNAQSSPEAGDMFDDALKAVQQIDDTLNNTESDIYGRVGRQDYKASLDFILPESVDSTDQQAVNSYLDSIESMFTHNDKGERVGLDIQEFCQQAVDKGLMVLDEAGENYQVAGGKTMEDFANGLNLAMPFVQAMFGEMQEFGAEWSWADEAVQTMGDLGVAANEAAESLLAVKGNEKLKIRMDVSDLEDKADKISALNSTIKEMKRVKAKVGVSAEEVEQANTVIQYCVAQKQQLEAPAVMQVDTSLVKSKIGEAIALLQQFQTAQSNLQMQEALGLDTTEAQAQVEEVAAKIQALDTNVTTTLGIDTTSIETISDTIQTLTPEMMVDIGINETAIIGFQNAEHNSDGTVTWENDTKAVDSYATSLKHGKGEIAWYNNTNLVKTEFSASGTVHWRNANPPTGGTISVNGTAHVAGTALARDNWGTSTGGRTLVGELGREIVVDPFTGRWRTVGDNGAEFTNIPKGAIVFNHIQTEELLKNGFVASRAMALAGGTALASGTAMVTGGISVEQSKKPAQSASGSGHSDKTITNAANKVSSSADEVSNALDDVIKKLDNMKDWIERKIEIADQKIQKYQTRAEQAGGGRKTENNLERAITALNEKLELLKASKVEYRKQADSVASSIGLSKDLKDKVENGTINIEVLSEEDKKRVDTYEKWFQKIVAINQQILDVQYDIVNTKQQEVQNVLDTYDVVIGKREAAQKKYQLRQELRVQQGGSQKPGSVYDKYMHQELYYANEQVRLGEKELAAYDKKMNEYLKSPDGANGDRRDREYQKMLINRTELVNSILEGKIAVEELKDAIQDNTEQIMQWGIDRWSRAGEKQDLVISYKQVADDRTLSEKDYTERMKSQSKEVEALQKLRDEKYQYYLKNLSAVSNEEAQKRLNEIADLDKQIIQAGIDMEELKNQIMELRWKPFEDAQEKLRRVTAEYETLMELLGDSEGFFNDDGSYTTNGMTNILLLQKSMESGKQQIANYREALDDLEEQYRNGCWSEEEYIQKTNELTDGIRDAATAVEGYRQQMLDMYRTQLKMENELLQENIDKRLEALGAKRAFYDYDKTLRKKSKDINSLKAQIQALSGTTNAASKARLERLKAELADAEEDMNDTMHQHRMELQESGYKDLSADAEQALQNTLDALIKNTDFQKAVINNMLDEVTAGYDSAYEHLGSVIDEYGIKVSNTFDQMIQKVADFNREVASVTPPSFGGMDNSGVNMGSDIAQGIIKDTVNGNDTASEAGKLDFEKELKKQAQAWYDSLPPSQHYEDKSYEQASPVMRLFMSNNKGVNGKRLQKLADIIGFNFEGYDPDHPIKWPERLQNDFIREAKKYIRFAEGGLVDYGRYIPVEELNNAVRSSGEWGLAGVRRGELILNQNVSKTLLNAVPQIAFMADTLGKDKTKMVTATGISGMQVYNNAPLINIEGNVDGGVLDDLQALRADFIRGALEAFDKQVYRDVGYISGKKRY